MQKIEMIPLTSIDFTKHNTRGEGSSTSRANSTPHRKRLFASVIANGNNNTPILVYPDRHKSYLYTCANGHGRGEAMIRAHQSKISCIVRPMTIDEADACAIVHNRGDQTAWKHSHYHNIIAFKRMLERDKNIPKAINKIAKEVYEQDGIVQPEQQKKKYHFLNAIYHQYASIIKMPILLQILRNHKAKDVASLGALARVLYKRRDVLKIFEQQLAGRMHNNHFKMYPKAIGCYLTHLRTAKTSRAYKSAFLEAFINKSNANKHIVIGRNSFYLGFMPGKFASKREAGMFLRKARLSFNHFYKEAQARLI